MGFKKGSKRPIPGTNFELALQSPLSRQYIFTNYFKRLKENSSGSYDDEKCLALDYQKAKKIFLEHNTFKAWPVRSTVMKSFRNSILLSD